MSPALSERTGDVAMSPGYFEYCALYATSADPAAIDTATTAICGGENHDNRSCQPIADLVLLSLIIRVPCLRSTTVTVAPNTCRKSTKAD